MRRVTRLLADVSPLRESPAFRRLWAGSTLSSVGGALTAFAGPLQVYDITRSPPAVGAIVVAEMVPTLGIGLLGGSLADAIDRRRLVLVTTGCLAAVSAALAAQAFAGPLARQSRQGLALLGAVAVWGACFAGFAGALGSLTSPAVSALAGGVLTVAGVVVTGLRLPAFTRYRAEPDAGQPRNG